MARGDGGHVFRDGCLVCIIIPILLLLFCFGVTCILMAVFGDLGLEWISIGSFCLVAPFVIFS